MTISRPTLVTAKWHYFVLSYGSVVFHHAYMYHVFFIHSSLDGHLHCFHVSASVNSAAMNIGVHVSFSVRVLSGYMPKSGMADSNGNFTLFSSFF